MIKQMGRPTLCTPELITEIADYIRGGMTQREAAIRAGIDEGTYHRWQNEGRTRITQLQNWAAQNLQGPPPPGDTPNSDAYAHFHAETTQARAEAEGLFIGVVRTAAANADWKAAAWWLERSIPERWGRRDHHTLASDGDQPLVIHLQFEDGPDPDEPKPGDIGPPA